MPHFLRIPHGTPVLGGLSQIIRREEPRPVTVTPKVISQQEMQRQFSFPQVRPVTISPTQPGLQFNQPLPTQDSVIGVQTQEQTSGGGEQAPAQTQAPTGKTGTTPSLESLFVPQPTVPQIDFNAMIAPAIEGLEATIGPLTRGTEEIIRGIEAQRGTRLAGAQTAFGEQERGLERARTRQEQLGESAAAEARRQFAEFQQGVGARFGRRTSTGLAAAEIGATQTFRNIANIRQQVSNAMLQIDDKLAQVQEVGRIATQEIEDNTRAQIGQARNQLDLSLAEIRRQKGELQAKKAELAGQAIQIYQNAVNQVNAQNATFKQNLFLQQRDAENKLQLAQQRARQVSRDVNPFGFINIPLGGTLFRTNKRTGQVERVKNAAPGIAPGIAPEFTPSRISKEEYEFLGSIH